ncbi:hydrogenase/urease accessory protein HupE [Propionicimonas paludicola]|uniref:Hydrogenase/urease accessory protein HupE n=1 Tax=Propionicimonas paludicola TaxID=185243 RepID=A0A2A9CX02_9ACTN|nr:HupE/UreJ family protein [Propionicimonas paludicola]PFG18160.1 hydrogenase/urease accessory protein HupE [Propionicimonas paludicola]
MPHTTVRPAARNGALIAITILLGAGWFAPAASAHGFSSVVYASVAPGEQSGRVRAELQLEYDLLVVSAADTQHTDQLFRDGTAAFEDQDATAQASALTTHLPTVQAYVDERFRISADGAPCPAQVVGPITMSIREGVPYAGLVLDADCARPSDAHEITSTLFADSEGFVTGTTTILTYDLDLHSGSAALTAQQPSFSTAQSVGQRFWEFFQLGAEHLLGGLDHILFLLALIVGSRRLREVIYAASAFTLAHSVTFILAATHTASLPPEFVEPTIAASIAVVGAWHLFRVRKDPLAAPELASRTTWGLDRAGRLRLAVVFIFGLVHGMGFASALGIDEPWSWTLLWSLLVFNLGIEVVQIGIIAITFPLLALLRRRAPRWGGWVSILIASGVVLAGAIWFVQRILG